MIELTGTMVDVLGMRKLSFFLLHWKDLCIVRSTGTGTRGGTAPPPSKTGGKRPAWDVKGKERPLAMFFLLGLSVSILVKWEVCREISSIKMWLSDHFLGRMEDMEKKFEQSCKRLEALEAEKQELQEDVEVKHEVVVKSSEEIR